jgi:unspecific monooxygenase
MPAGPARRTSNGEDWRHQRRTIAPALAPRVMPMLARHVASAAQETIARLAAGAREPVDLLAAMQFLALEIAAARCSHSRFTATDPRCAG